MERLQKLAPWIRRRWRELEAKWMDMFELEEDMCALARDLSARHKVYLLSNIGDLHWGHLSRSFGLHQIGHGALLSFEAGVMKPEDAHLQRGGAALRPGPGAHGIHRRPRGQHRHRPQPRLAWHRPPVPLP